MDIDPFVNTFIDTLSTRYNKKWSQYLFHYSDILNIVSILETGQLCSRAYSLEKDILSTDSASQEVLSSTPDCYKDFVRLYFRPRTPPLYHIEGFCPNNNLRSIFNAHCPVPIYLLFNSKKILSLPKVQFSSGNLSASSNCYTDMKNLSLLEFDKIYHDSYLPYDNDAYKREIVNKRCAEVIIPKILNLEGNLERIVCRSVAERETLVNLLSSKIKQKYIKKIYHHSPYFFNKKQYVKQVKLDLEKITIEYNNNRISPFEYKYTFIRNKKKTVLNEAEQVPVWTWVNNKSNYTLEIHIDEHIAYKGHFSLL